MTDVAPATIEFWTRHPAFVPFVRDRRLDFAHFDAARDTSPTLLFERAEIADAAPVARLVVIANYVFSGLPQDAFVSRRGRLHEWLIHTSAPRRRPDAMVLTGRLGVRATTVYDDEAFNRVLRERGGVRGVRLFPIGTLRCLQRLLTLAAEDALVLVADRPDPGAGLDAATLGMGRHGPCRFPWISRHCARGRGCAAARRSDRVGRHTISRRRPSCWAVPGMAGRTLEVRGAAPWRAGARMRFIIGVADSGRPAGQQCPRSPS
jgi:hypothetical protein